MATLANFHQQNQLTIAANGLLSLSSLLKIEQTKKERNQEKHLSIRFSINE